MGASPCESADAHGKTAPSRSVLSGSGTSRSRSTFQALPSPWHSGHEPSGELNENPGGDSSGKLRSQIVQWSCSLAGSSSPVSTRATVAIPEP